MMGTEGWRCYNQWREINTEALEILKKIEDSLEQDNYYGLDHLINELRECLEEPF